MKKNATEQKPQNVKNLIIGFFILSLAMLGGQAVNLIITLLPEAAETTVQIDAETTVTVASLRNAYIASTVLVALVYGLTWFWLGRSKNWARWVAVVLAALAAVGGARGLLQVLAAGSFDFVAGSLNLAQLIAAGWVLALSFRKDVSSWFKKPTDPIEHT